MSLLAMSATMVLPGCFTHGNDMHCIALQLERPSRLHMIVLRWVRPDTLPFFYPPMRISLLLCPWQECMTCLVWLCRAAVPGSTGSLILLHPS